MARTRGRALITRPREESQRLAAALAQRGVAAVIASLIEINYLASEELDLGGVQAVLCTSVNGVRALARASGERRLLVLAVGDATAACARAEGFTTVESAGGDVAHLARLAAARLRSQDGSLLHVTGDVVAGDLVGALQAQGFIVERRVLYRARPAAALSPDTVAALRSGAVDFALFFSPRTAAIFARLAAAADLAGCFAAIVALSISPAADAALADFAWLDRRIPAWPNQAGLLEALDDVLAARHGG
jgi:uroporphyrinogen-III synthase